MFKYFGYFIGCAIRSEQSWPLDLAPIFWKLITDEIDTESDEERLADLKAFDTYSWQVVDDLINNTKDLSDEDFNAGIDEYFVTLLSNGEQVELIPGGRSVKVTKTNLNEYTKAIVEARIHESAKQIRAIKEGIQFVIPMNIVKLLNWKQVEVRATGSKTIEIDKLKSVTVYDVIISLMIDIFSLFRTGQLQTNTFRYSGESWKASPKKKDLFI